jgi:hypothetical protein
MLYFEFVETQLSIMFLNKKMQQINIFAQIVCMNILIIFRGKRYEYHLF